MHFNIILDRVEKPGQWAGSWNENTGKLWCYYWSTDSNIGKKYILTIALFKQQQLLPKGVILVYDMYVVMFSLCDQFNRFVKKFNMKLY